MPKLFPHKVEKAAVKAIGLLERGAEKRRQNRGRIFQTGFFTPQKFFKGARKVMKQALPGSTPRLREAVIDLVERRRGVSQAKAWNRFRFRLKRKKKQ